MLRTCWRLFPLLVVGLAACSDNSKYLPKPRVSSDDDEAPPAAVAQQPPPAAVTPNPVTPSRAAPPQAVDGAPPIANVATNGGRTPEMPAVTQQKASELDRRTRVINQMRKISKALESYREKNSAYPSSTLAGGLSWRVRLLPLLGHQDLYGKFRLSEPWDSPANRPLLDQIPDEYRSPERTDASTCYQLVKGPETAFADPDGFNPEVCRDGIDHTILLVEIHKDLARPWTAPDDYVLQKETIQRDWFGMRQDCCFVAMGGAASVRRIAADIPDAQLLGLITPNGGEPVRYQDATTYAHPEVDLAVRQKLEQQPLTTRFAAPPPANDPAAGVKPISRTPDSDAARATTEGTEGPARSVASSPVDPATSASKAVDVLREPPNDEQLEAATSIVRDLYGDEYKNAKQNKDKRDFARKLLDDVERIEADAAGRFVLLRAARDIAAKAGDISAALDACDKLGRDFRVDLLSMKLKVLEQVVTNLQAEADLDPLYDTSLKLGDEALQLDDFNSAKSLYRLAMNAARRGRKADREYAVNLREERLRETKLAYARVTDHVHTLVRSPEDPAANAAVGRYYALLKQDWDRGLPMLARGNDARLKGLAESDLARPADGEAQVAIADQWWELAEKSSVATEKTSARMRARHWYESAQPSLGASLQKIRVEKRLQQPTQRLH